jgi:hypothetical protein
VNLYGFVGNDGLNWVDIFGLASTPMPDGWEDFKCCDLGKLIKTLMDALKERHSEMRLDVNFLYRNPNPPPRVGTWSGHQQMFRQTQSQLRKVIDKFDTKNCPDPPLGARRWSTEPAPRRPAPNPNHPYMTEADQVLGRYGGSRPSLAAQPQIPAELWQQAQGMAGTSLGAGVGAGLLAAPFLAAGGVALGTAPASAPSAAAVGAGFGILAPAFAN